MVVIRGYVIGLALFIAGILIGLGIDYNIRYPYSDTATAITSPNDHILASDLAVYKDKAVINIDNLMWAMVQDTHSMEPALNKNSISLERKPVSENEVGVGDIISFNSENMVKIHRVVSTGFDDDGWYAVTKGDNNEENDAGKVRFSDVVGIVVGVLY